MNKLDTALKLKKLASPLRIQHDQGGDLTGNIGRQGIEQMAGQYKTFKGPLKVQTPHNLDNILHNISPKALNLQGSAYKKSLKNSPKSGPV